MMKSDNSSSLFSTWLAFLSGCTVLILLGEGFFGENGVKQHRVLRRDLATLREQLEQAELKYQRLQAEERALREQPQYVEWVIRQELGWVRSEEIVLMLDSASEM